MTGRSKSLSLISKCILCQYCASHFIWTFSSLSSSFSLVLKRSDLRRCLCENISRVGKQSLLLEQADLSELDHSTNLQVVKFSEYACNPTKEIDFSYFSSSRGRHNNYLRRRARDIFRMAFHRGAASPLVAREKDQIKNLKALQGKYALREPDSRKISVRRDTREKLRYVAGVRMEMHVGE